MTFRQYSTIFFCTLLGVCALSGCADGDEAETYLPTLYDVADITDQSSGGTTFTIYRPDAEPSEVKLFAPGFTTNQEIGLSVFLSYIPESGKPYVSGNISVKQIGMVNNSNLKRGNDNSLAGWEADPVWLLSLWQGGEKVYMRMQLPYSDEPRRLALVIDEATAENEYPDAYLFHRRNELEPNYMRQYYCAFNLSELWKMPECHGLNIHVANSNNPRLTLFTISNPHYQQSADQ